MICARIAPFVAVATIVVATAGNALKTSDAAGYPVSDDEYNLIRVFKTGEVDRYRTKLKIEGNKGTIEINLVTTDTVKEVKPDGSYTIQTRIDSGTLNIGGSTSPFAGVGQAVITTFDRAGKMLKTESAGNDRGKGLAELIGITRLNFTNTDGLKIGETRKFDVPMGEGGQKAFGTIKILKLEKPGNEIKVETVRVQTLATLSGPTDSTAKPVRLDSTSLVDPRTAVVHKLTGSATDLPLGTLGAGKVLFDRVRIDNGAS
jgi:hypothetical protein